MHRCNKAIVRILLVLLLAICFNSAPGLLSTLSTAQAATVTPSLKEKKKTLYAGYNTYTIQLNNKSKSAKISYKTSNTKVASVSSKGVVTPKKKGTATITVTVKQNKKTYNLKTTITVLDPAISLSQSTDYLNVGDTYEFKATVTGMKDKVVWSISDSKIATITSTGKVTALASGNVKVMATAGGITVEEELYIGLNSLGTFSTEISIYTDLTIWITTPTEIKDEKLQLSTENGLIDCTWGSWSDDRISLTISPKKIGVDTITIISEKSADRLKIKVNVIETPVRKELTSKEVYSKCSPSTVEIYATDGDYNSTGSGFFVGDGKVVTNYHVIDGANSIKIKTYDNKEFIVDYILGYDEKLDLAVLQMKGNYESLVISQDGPVGGEEIYALGSPLGLSGTMTKGMISTASRRIEGEDAEFIQIDAAISPGNSGGPLINSYGEVIGINTLYYINGQNLNFAVNIKEIQKINTNQPILVKDYYAKYEKDLEDWYNANVIEEDTTASQYIETCQNVPSGMVVMGSINKDENGDCYYFELNQAATLSTILRSQSYMDYMATYFELYTYDAEFVMSSKVYSESDYFDQIINTELKPGKYLLFVSTYEDYEGSDIDYMFFLMY